MTTYVTKKDAWLVLAITGTIAVLLFIGVQKLWEGSAPPFVGWMLIGMALFTAVVFYSFAQYELTRSELVIRSQLYGIRFEVVPYSEIQAIYPTRNPLSAAAWSLDRLHIIYFRDGKERFTLISPKDRGAFMRDLARRVPELEGDEKKLVRKPRLTA
jgi:hypothetical protein